MQSLATDKAGVTRTGDSQITVKAALTRMGGGHITAMMGVIRRDGRRGVRDSGGRCQPAIRSFSAARSAERPWASRIFS